MKAPTEFQLQHMPVYDPVKAHTYYEEHKKLKGRKKGLTKAANAVARARSADPRTGKTKQQIAKDARTKQRKELAVQIQGMEQRLNKLEALIQKRQREEASEDRKGKAKKERAKKDADKPKSAAEKAKSARENKKYRDKNQQKLNSAAKKSGGKADASSEKPKSKHSVSDLKALATKVKGQIAVAKQKLAAL